MSDLDLIDVSPQCPYGYPDDFWDPCGSDPDGIIQREHDGKVTESIPEIMSYSNVGQFASETHILFGFNAWSEAPFAYQRNANAMNLHQAQAYFTLVTHLGDFTVTSPTSDGGLSHPIKYSKVAI